LPLSPPLSLVATFFAMKLPRGSTPPSATPSPLPGVPPTALTPLVGWLPAFAFVALSVNNGLVGLPLSCKERGTAVS
jgi:hypothetical protein